MDSNLTPPGTGPITTAGAQSWQAIAGFGIGNTLQQPHGTWVLLIAFLATLLFMAFVATRR